MQKNVESNGITLWTESFGKEGDPAIILLAGAGAPALFWTESFCTHLVNAGFFVIRFDYRDTGLSSTIDFTAHPYTINDLTEDVIVIMDDYGIKKAHIVGHSMGGFIAQFLAAYHPDRILSIVMIAAGAAGLPKTLPESMSKAERDQMAKTWEIIMSNAPTEDYEESLPGFIKVWRYLMGDIELDEGMVADYVRDLYYRAHRKIGPHQEHMAVMQGMARTISSRVELFDAIKARSLVIHGEKDYLMVCERGGKVLAQALTGAKFVMVPKMGHMLFNHELERYLAEVILQFIQTIK